MLKLGVAFRIIHEGRLQKTYFSNKNEYDIRKNGDGGQLLLQKATSQSTDKLCWPFLSEPQMEGQSLARAESAADFFEPRYYALTQGDEIPKEF
ncbi:hypothetical protein Tco_1036440 [Tanacetum coccineum]